MNTAKITISITISMPVVICRIAAQPVLLYRQLKYGYSFRKIQLTKGKFAKVDQRDYERFREMRCFATLCGAIYYAACKINSKNFLMHRLIMEPPKGMVVDHINGDGLDNRRANLRICTKKQNNYNRRIQGRGASKYKGVSWKNRDKRWRATLYYEKKQIFLGCFETEIEAAKAYDRAAVKYYKEYARVNFPAKKDNGILKFIKELRNLPGRNNNDSRRCRG